MPAKRKRHTGYQGLIADTAEMPAIVSTPKEPIRPTRRTKAQKRRPFLVVILAILGSFALGLGVRMVVDIPALINDLAPKMPGLRSIASPEPVAPGDDIATELGEKLEVPMFVEQVLPFNARGSRPQYTVLGGYLLNESQTADKKKPIMVVFKSNDLEEPPTVRSLTTVAGYVVMGNGTEQTAASVLNPDQEADLSYIAARVNFWDRVTILGTSMRPFDPLR